MRASNFRKEGDEEHLISTVCCILWEVLLCTCSTTSFIMLWCPNEFLKSSSNILCLTNYFLTRNLEQLDFIFMVLNSYSDNQFCSENCMFAFTSQGTSCNDVMQESAPLDLPFFAFGYDKIWFHPCMIPYSKPAQSTSCSKIATTTSIVNGPSRASRGNAARLF